LGGEEGAEVALLAGEDLLGERAGVLRVDVDLAGAQRFPQDLRAAELAPVGRRHARRLQLLRDELAEEHALGEDLAAHAHVGEERDEQDRAHAMLRCACTNLVTNASAGASRSAAMLPSCTTRPSRMSTMRLPRNAASPRSCVTSTTVLPRSAKIRP